MPPKSGETVQRKSAAEFFTENQNIAGFDNPGKSLYTTIRELVENSLDAAESIGVPPTIEVTVQELSQKELDAERGVTATDIRRDAALFAAAAAGKKKPKAKKKDGDAGDDDDPDRAATAKGAQMYYRVTCRDNGCGMRRAAIPDALGRVLAGSKYGVRQTRGKFGLGAKMALIWAKKSSGMPVSVRTAYVAAGDAGAPSPGGAAAGPPGAAHCSKIVLDIDIQKNEPRVLEDAQEANPGRWRGTELTVTVGGAWRAYKARVVAYLRQLAIITPYATLSLDFRGSGGTKRDVRLRFERRTTKVPPLPTTTGYHPSAVNELLLEQLLRRTKASGLAQFLSRSGALSSITANLAKRVVAECGKGFRADDDPVDVADDRKKLQRLARLLREVSIFPPPDGACLSPVGEYNLRLGVEKEVRPDYVATCASPPKVHDGHAFQVEVAVSVGGVGGTDEPGLTVFRFANRIPLLFEGGADVATRVANRKVKWGNYKIDVKREKISVFVSLVSTRIPFKGTSKEYIGEDATEIHDAVKDCLCRCGLQLKAQLLKRDLAKQGRDRKKNLLRYVPDVAGALWKVLGGLEDAGPRRPPPDCDEKTLAAALRAHVDKLDLDAAEASFQAAGGGRGAKRRIDMRRRAVVEDLVGAHFAFRLFARAAAPVAPSSDDEAAARPPAAKKKKPAAAATRVFDAGPDVAAPAPAARTLDFDDDDDDEDVFEVDGLSPFKAPPPRAAGPKRSRKAVAYDVDGSGDDDDEEEEAARPKPKARAAAAPPPKKRAKPKRAVASSDDDDDDDADAAPPPPKRGAAPKRGRKPASYAVDDDDDDDDDDDAPAAPAKRARPKSSDCIDVDASDDAAPPPRRQAAKSDSDSSSEDDVPLTALARSKPKARKAPTPSDSSDGEEPPDLSPPSPAPAPRAPPPKPRAPPKPDFEFDDDDDSSGDDVPLSSLLKKPAGKSGSEIFAALGSGPAAGGDDEDEEEEWA